MEFKVIKGTLNNGKQEAGPGEMVDLSKAEAAGLIEQGIVRPMEKRKKAEKDEA